mmetsp:Transcript_9229/g.20852  ORF Transcript_9229/g.20852 Transcript_9229/m.20852 type:complete len:751 (+) Transcript_9229:263-2515(+)
MSSSLCTIRSRKRRATRSLVETGAQAQCSRHEGGSTTHRALARSCQTSVGPPHWYRSTPESGDIEMEALEGGVLTRVRLLAVAMTSGMGSSAGQEAAAAGLGAEHFASALPADCAPTRRSASSAEWDVATHLALRLAVAYSTALLQEGATAAAAAIPGVPPHTASLSPAAARPGFADASLQRWFERAESAVFEARLRQWVEPSTSPASRRASSPPPQIDAAPGSTPGSTSGSTSGSPPPPRGSPKPAVRWWMTEYGLDYARVGSRWLRKTLPASAVDFLEFTGDLPCCLLESSCAVDSTPAAAQASGDEPSIRQPPQQPLQPPWTESPLASSGQAGAAPTLGTGQQREDAVPDLLGPHFVLVPFSEAPPWLVASRRLVLWGGHALVPEREMIRVVAYRFKEHLRAQVALLAHSAAASLAASDPRFSELFRAALRGLAMHAGVAHEALPLAGGAGEPLTEARLDLWFRQDSLPLCARRLHARLHGRLPGFTVVKARALGTHRGGGGGWLHHDQRRQYYLFLKSCGMSVHGTVRVLKQAFDAANATPAGAEGGGHVVVRPKRRFDKYDYDVRHHYGLRGNRQECPPFSCSQLVAQGVPKYSDQGVGGCPFANLDTPALQAELEGWGLSAREAAALAQRASGASAVDPLAASPPSSSSSSSSASSSSSSSSASSGGRQWMGAAAAATGVCSAHFDLSHAAKARALGLPFSPLADLLPSDNSGGGGQGGGGLAFPSQWAAASDRLSRDWAHRRA